MNSIYHYHIPTPGFDAAVHRYVVIMDQDGARKLMSSSNLIWYTVEKCAEVEASDRKKRQKREDEEREKREEEKKKYRLLTPEQRKRILKRNWM